MIGSLGVFSHSFYFAPDPPNPVEVPKLVEGHLWWDMAYGLSASYRGQGIVSEAVACLIEGWVKPWMGIDSLGAVSCSTDFLSLM